jgi:hypothetical protein
MTLGHTVTAGRLIRSVSQLSHRGHGQTSGALMHEMEDLLTSTKRRVPYIHAVTRLENFNLVCISCFFGDGTRELRKRGVSFQGTVYEKVESHCEKL